MQKLIPNTRRFPEVLSIKAFIRSFPCAVQYHSGSMNRVPIGILYNLQHQTKFIPISHTHKSSKIEFFCKIWLCYSAAHDLIYTTILLD
jgi:hypothetical protein